MTPKEEADRRGPGTLGTEQLVEVEVSLRSRFAEEAWRELRARIDRSNSLSHGSRGSHGSWVSSVCPAVFTRRSQNAR
jgi:hypothetical protein